MRDRMVASNQELRACPGGCRLENGTTAPSISQQACPAAGRRSRAVRYELARKYGLQPAWTSPGDPTTPPSTSSSAAPGPGRRSRRPKSGTKAGPAAHFTRR